MTNRTTNGPTAAQARAIAAPPGPLLVVAGPGAGKTFCLIERIRHLILEQGIPADRICAVTYTNKAAGEIALRLDETMPGVSAQVRRGTVHSVAVEILRAWPVEAGLDAGFGIADDAAQMAILDRMGYHGRRGRALLGAFSRHRLRGDDLDPEDVPVLQGYLSRLVRGNLVDFDGILVRMAALLDEHAGLAERIATRWDAILVDEFQDVNRLQYRILTRLAPHRHLFAVGDDDQSIFSWTGADPEVLTRFQRDFGVVEPIILDRNHRSSVAIFDRARALVRRNPSLFDKALEATRESPHPVVALRFPTEKEEASWILGDLAATRARNPSFRWGDAAILYRMHAIGALLERELLGAGIPCRLARGQALGDDPIVAVILRSLRVMSAPGDPGALEALAHAMLPHDLIQEAGLAECSDLVATLRAHAACLPRDAPHRRHAWRFVYFVENLRGLMHSAGSIRDVVRDLLGQKLGTAQGPLDRHAPELSDPAEHPGAPALAGRLRAAAVGGSTIWIEPDRGIEAGLRAMLHAADSRYQPRILIPGSLPTAEDVVLRGADVTDGGWPVRLFKALQLASAAEEDRVGDGAYVTFDLETTDLDIATCETIEIGAARVRHGQVADRFHTLVRPAGPVSEGATRVHGYRDEDLRDAPPFAEAWERFRAFVGDDLVVAHNGQGFDIPVLKRQAAPHGGTGTMAFLDTLPLARAVVQGSARLEHLAQQYGVDTGTSHHALDDAICLVGVYEGLKRDRARRNRTVALPQLLGPLGLALALASAGPADPEKVLLRRITRAAALGPWSQMLEHYASWRDREGTPEAPTLQVVIERLGGHRLLEKIRAEKRPEDRHPAALARLESLLALVEQLPLAEAIPELLDRAALSTSDSIEADPDRVNLLTLHATKGLEFATVYIAGVEDLTMPGARTMREGRAAELPESRRLLYVGMTRARDRLILTRAESRNGEPGGGNLFLDEMGLDAQWVMP